MADTCVLDTSVKGGLCWWPLPVDGPSGTTVGKLHHGLVILACFQEPESSLLLLVHPKV